MKKRIFLGMHDHGECYVEINLIDGKLSIYGEHWLPSKKDMRQCGQCLDTLLTYFPNDAKLIRIVDIWNRYHLNDMNAGSPAQETWLRCNPVKAVYPESHYEVASKALEQAGLNPDPGYLHNGQPYKYGHAWIKEEIPDHIIKEIESW